MTAELFAKRAEAVEQLEQLRHQRDLSVLDDTAFDHIRIAALEQKITALDHAISEQQLRKSAQQLDTEREHITALLVEELKRVELDRTEAIRHFEKVTSEFADSISRLVAANANLRATVRKLNLRCPLSIDENGIVRRASQHIGRVLGPAVSHSHRFGSLTFVPGAAPAGGWAEAEIRGAAADIQSIIDQAREDRRNGRDRHSDEIIAAI